MEIIIAHRKKTASLRCAPDQTRCSHKTQDAPGSTHLKIVVLGGFLMRNFSTKTAAETKNEKRQAKET
jgi:hypothetical protein